VKMLMHTYSGCEEGMRQGGKPLEVMGMLCVIFAADPVWRRGARFRHRLGCARLPARDLAFQARLPVRHAPRHARRDGRLPAARHRLRDARRRRRRERDQLHDRAVGDDRADPKGTNHGLVRPSFQSHPEPPLILIGVRYHSHPFDVDEAHNHCFLSSTDMSTQLAWQNAEDGAETRRRHENTPVDRLP
jgi:hypothetical protein